MGDAGHRERFTPAAAYCVVNLDIGRGADAVGTLGGRRFDREPLFGQTACLAVTLPVHGVSTDENRIEETVAS
jgi:hypothetical protein